MKCVTILCAAFVLGLALAAAPVQAAETMDFVSDESGQEGYQEVFSDAEEMPQFPNGMSALTQYVGKNIQYPDIALENGIQGRVVVSFVVNRDGSVADVAVVRGVDPALDKEACRVISAMPKWRPGKQRGKPVRVRMQIPVTFRLN